MNSEISSSKYWNNIYNAKKDVWTLNNPNPVLVQIVEGKKIAPPGKILVAGSGKGDDAIYLAQKGFDVSAIDFSEEAINFSSKLAENEGVVVNFMQNDLFSIKTDFPDEFDFIYEYVTLCAIDPDRIEELIEAITSALKVNGLFVTIPFPIDKREGGPPFTIELERFYNIACKYLKLEYYAKDINSVKPRKGKEVLMIFKKRE